MESTIPRFCRFLAIRTASVLLIFLCIHASAQSFIAADRKPVTERFITHIMYSDFDSALAIADSLNAVSPSDPMGSLYRLFTLGMRQLDLDVLLDSAGFVEWYDATMRKIHAYEKAHGKTPYAMTLAGFANAAHASYYLRLEKYFAAIGTGMDALKILNEVKAMDSTNADADFFIGMYDYAKGELRKRLWMLLFWYPGDKKEGIAKLEGCAKNADLAHVSARLALADIYVTEKQFGKARTALDALQRDYPDSRFTLWTEAKYYEAQEKWELAAKQYARLAESYAKSRGGDYNALVTRYRQMEMLVKEGNCREDLVRVAKLALDTGKGRTNRHLEIRKKIEKLIDKETK